MFLRNSRLGEQSLYLAYHPAVLTDLWSIVLRPHILITLPLSDLQRTLPCHSKQETDLWIYLMINHWQITQRRLRKYHQNTKVFLLTDLAMERPPLMIGLSVRKEIWKLLPKLSSMLCKQSWRNECNLYANGIGSNNYKPRLQKTPQTITEMNLNPAESNGLGLIPCTLLNNHQR
jgi:hypothetical protein